MGTVVSSNRVGEKVVIWGEKTMEEWAGESLKPSE